MLSFYSAYYGLPVTVVVKKCADLGDGLFDREVEVLVNGQVRKISSFKRVLLLTSPLISS